MKRVLNRLCALLLSLMLLLTLCGAAETLEEGAQQPPVAEAEEALEGTAVPDSSPIPEETPVPEAEDEEDGENASEDAETSVEDVDNSQEDGEDAEPSIPESAEEAPDRTDEEELPEDGDYSIAIESDFPMFAIVRSTARVQDGLIIVTIGTEKTTYDRIFLGSKDAEDKSDFVQGVLNAAGSGYDFTFDLPKSYMGQTIDFVPGKPDGTWYEKKQYHLTIPTVLEKADEEPGEKPEESPAPEDSPAPTLEDGDYKANVESSSSMFKVVNCVLSAKDGEYRAVITLSGTGYDKLYVGTAEAAQTAADADCVHYAADAEGRYTFDLPVAALDTPIAVAAHSVNKDAWYDRTLTFRSEGLEKITETDPEGTPEPEATSTPEATPAPTATPAPEKDVGGSTSRVDNSTALADGVYTPEKFSFSGGTGRVSISCTKVTVTGGKAVATIVFSSSSYAYVKANGQKYYPSVSGGTSTFSIPVKLNSNNRILGMTTAMSVDHEVEYTIYVYIRGAEPANEAAQADGAPEIAGLRYVSRDENADAKLFTVYRYEGGFAVIEVADAGRYLLAPEGAELPVGLEDEAVVIHVPVCAAYVASEGALALIDRIDVDAADSPVKFTGCENVPLQRLAELAFAGEASAPDYAALLAGGCDLAILPGVFAKTEPDALSAEERAALDDVAERLSMLGIPAFVDRSAEEESERAQLEWIRLYGVLLGCEDAAQACYERAVEALSAAA